MHKAIAFLVLFTCVIQRVCAQSTKLISATRQDWSGGVAGHSGSRFTFSIEFSGYNEEPIPDTIWIGKKPVPLFIKGKAKPEIVNTRRISSNETIRFIITTSIAHDAFGDHSPYASPLPREVNHTIPIQYKGVALLSYRYKGSEKYFEIRKFSTILPPMNYP